MQEGKNDEVEALAFTYGQVARAANVSERTVRNLVRNGRLKVVHIGRAARVPRPAMLRLCGIDRWFGGVHVSGRGPAWRWSADAGRLLEA